MSYNRELVNELKEQYIGLEKDIEKRIDHFSSIWSGKDEKTILKELYFCILTPQSKATTCWGAIEELTRKDLLLNGSYDEVLNVVGTVRFKYRKAQYILEAREKFVVDGKIILVNLLEEFKDPLKTREWLVSKVKGYGYKEASHFLRNIGLGEKLTILDRHILKNLAKAEVIDRVPDSMTEKKYLAIEEKMRIFADDSEIPLSHLDLLLWYREAGEIFK